MSDVDPKADTKIMMTEKELERKRKEKYERRKVLHIDDRVICDAMMAVSRGEPVPQLVGLPNDIEFTEAHYDFSRKGFAFVCCSEEWPIHNRATCMDAAEFDLVHPPQGNSQLCVWEKFGRERFHNVVPVPQVAHKLGLATKGESDGDNPKEEEKNHG